MALAMEKNKRGKIITYEVIDVHRNDAIRLFNQLKVTHRIQSNLQSSLETTDCRPIDFLFLDSEPQYRFDEFNLYWKWVKPGGIIGIHDLHPSLGHTGIAHHGMMDWPFGDFRTKIGRYIKEHKVQVWSFPTIRGVTFFQKEAPNFGWTKHLRS